MGCYGSNRGQLRSQRVSTLPGGGGSKVTAGRLALAPAFGDEANEAREGVGLGLNLCRKKVRAHISGHGYATAPTRAWREKARAETQEK